MAAPAPGQLRPYRAYKERRPKSQLAGGAPIHKNVAYVRSAAPRNLNRRGTGGYIGNKTAIVKARFFTESLGFRFLFSPHLPACEKGTTLIYPVRLLNEIFSSI